MGPSGGPAAAIPAGIFVFNLVVCVTRSTVFFNDFNLPAAFDILIDLTRKQVGSLDVMQRRVRRGGRRRQNSWWCIQSIELSPKLLSITLLSPILKIKTLD